LGTEEKEKAEKGEEETSSQRPFATACRGSKRKCEENIRKGTHERSPQRGDERAPFRRLTLMSHKSYQTGMPPNLSNAVFWGILWGKCDFTKGSLCHMLGNPIFNVIRWPLESFSTIPVCWIM
jgi:hypothetical protein